LTGRYILFVGRPGQSLLPGCDEGKVKRGKKRHERKGKNGEGVGGAVSNQGRLASLGKMPALFMNSRGDTYETYARPLHLTHAREGGANHLDIGLQLLG